jgi:Protein of unknown function (DUF3089)
MQAGLTSNPCTPRLLTTVFSPSLERLRTERVRRVALIGHSQGRFMLRELVKREIDRKPAVRRRLISGLLLGGT